MQPFSRSIDCSLKPDFSGKVAVKNPILRTETGRKKAEVLQITQEIYL